MMKIILADDHTLFREGLQYLLHELDPHAVMLAAGDYAAAAALLEEHADAALALVDLDMPGREREGGIERLLALVPTMPVVVLSACEDASMVRRVLDAGAMGFIPKRERPDVMLGALRLVLAGGVYLPPMLLASTPTPAPATPLTPRQAQVLHCLAHGHSNKVIARQLGMTEATVKAHTGSIFRSLEVSNRAQAVLVARRQGLLPRE